MNRRLLFGLLVWAASSLYVAGFVSRGWVPHDEGMLGHNAERVARGELPHADFDESYTGGLTEWHALLFRLFGVRLVVLRHGLYAFFLALFVPAVYAIASRLLPPAGAALLALTIVAWSFPNYFASMPSWYVLTFALLGALCLLEERDSGRRAWIFGAGLCGGLALTVHIVGLYVVAAVLLYLAFREQESAAAGAEASGGTAFFVFEAAAVGAFLALLLSVVWSRLDPMWVLQLVVPAFAVSAVLLVRAWRLRGRGATGRRARALAALGLPFLVGVCLPVAIFLVPYVRRGAVDALYRGLFVLPFRQMAAATMRFPPLQTAAPALPYALLLGLAVLAGRSGGRGLVVALAVGLALVFSVTGSETGYRAVWYSAVSLGVAAVLIGAAALMRPGQSLGGDAKRTGETFLFLCLAALLALLQFPYAAPIYFCYVAPLVALAVAALVRERPLLPHAAVAAFYLAFAVWRLNTGYIWGLGLVPHRYGPLATLDLPRAGLRVLVSDRDTYAALARAIQARTRGPYLWAAPDCPEVAFLAERRNPTRTVFDFLRDPVEPGVFVDGLLRQGVDGVVVNEEPGYSEPVGYGTRLALAAAYPNALRIRNFVLLWRR